MSVQALILCGVIPGWARQGRPYRTAAHYETNRSMWGITWYGQVSSYVFDAPRHARFL
jgi:hypothetical protein